MPSRILHLFIYSSNVRRHAPTLGNKRSPVHEEVPPDVSVYIVNTEERRAKSSLDILLSVTTHLQFTKHKKKTHTT